MGAVAKPLNGVERLKILNEILNADTKEPFHFHYGMVAGQWFLSLLQALVSVMVCSLAWGSFMAACPICRLLHRS
ncbi:hypothetical protein [Robinsoniella peoriensis]|uniref:hypothetical protein n=1 Tax=Robinsoniella peoriensis TaxID=180332 RepID=UPI003632F9EE